MFIQPHICFLLDEEFISQKGSEFAVDFILTAVEVRVLGALIEKEFTTPDYYPLTLNALVNACNQLSNREPVVSYDDSTVLDALFNLRGKRCARQISGADHRVPKYAEIFTEEFALKMPEIAVMDVLMLRGPQTPGELRSRGGRIYEFGSLAEVEETLQTLETRSPDPLIIRLPRQPGTKETRFAHLLSGEIKIERPEPSSATESVVSKPSAENERMAQLESEVAALRQELTDLKQQFLEFRKQFE